MSLPTQMYKDSVCYQETRVIGEDTPVEKLDAGSVFSLAF